MRDFSFSGYGFLPFGKRDKGQRERSLKEKLIEQLEVLAELGLPVAARQRDLEDRALRDERGQPGHGLLAGAADADQQRVAALHAKHAVQPD